MSTAYQQMAVTEIRHNLSSLHRKWGWFVALGLVMVIVGAFALSSVVVATFATALAIGIMLIAAGIVEVVGSFWSRGWSGFLLHMLFGVLAIVVGVLFLRAPVNAVLSLTLLMACLLMAGGLFNIISAVSFRFSGWGMSVVSGIIDLILGVLIWYGWPEASLWVLGLFLGISLIFRGIMWVGLGFALRAFRSDNDRRVAAESHS